MQQKEEFKPKELQKKNLKISMVKIFRDKGSDRIHKSRLGHYFL